MSIWNKEDNYDKAIKVILFIISPFFAFIYSLRKIKTVSSYIVFFLFFLFFGLSFTVPSGKTEVNSIDGASYREKFEYYKYINYKEYINGLLEYFTFKEGSKDFFFDTVAFYVSRITDNYHVMFLVVAVIFGYFSLKSLKFLTSENNFTNSLSCLILVYLFMINQIFNINGIRFWTAAWIGVYCIFQIFKMRNKKYFLLALCTPFVHGAFWIYFAVVIMAYFSKKNFKFWTVLFFISFVVSNFSIVFVESIIDSLPPFLSSMASAYTNEENIAERASQDSFISLASKLLINGYVNFLVFLFIKNAKDITANARSAGLFSFLLVWMTFVNFSMPIPSLGGRFVLLSYPVIAYIWLINFKGKKYDKVLYIMPFVFIYSFYLQFLLYITVLEPIFYFSSPIYLMYLYL